MRPKPTESFNEAAPVKARKFEMDSPLVIVHARFNEAAPVKARKS